MTEERLKIEATKRIIEKLREWGSKKPLSQHEKAAVVIDAWRDETVARLAAEERVRELRAETVLLKNQFNLFHLIYFRGDI